MRIRLLGGFSVSVGSLTIEDSAWRLKKGASLVKLLAITPVHRMHREQIMDFLWPDLGRQAASNNLRGVIHAARRILDPDSDMATRYLSLQGEQITLCPEAQLWVDVEAFEKAASAARRSQYPAAYRTAIELYSGELLPEDRYEEWAHSRREELRRLHLALLVELAALHEKRGEYEPAVEALVRVVADEPTLEEAHASLMRLYALSGRRGEALAQYRRVRKVLSEKLGAEPGNAIRRLRDEIAAGEFPPARTPPAGLLRQQAPDASQHNLPIPRTSFVGREREIVEVKRTLAMTRLLALTGAGGSGKTRLAIEVARDLIGLYPDGVWLVELAPLAERELVAQAAVETLGVREVPGHSLTDTLVDALKAKELLLLLDNCEHLIDACAHLADTLLGSCPRLRILATSREPLGVEGEAVWRVSSMSVPVYDRSPAAGELTRYDAVRLFMDRARLRLPDFDLTSANASAVAEVCRNLEGMPLAIELATARMGALAVEEVAQRLEDSLGFLTVSPRTVTPRQRTMRATLEWSYGLLSEPERVFFMRLSVFAGGWTLEAAEEVCPDGGIEEGEVLDLLSGLVDKSLVIVETGGEGRVRYRMLEPVRQYAREKLEESEGSDATLRRHAAFFLALAEGAEPELRGARQEAWLERLEAEHDNLRTALSWALRRGEAELGLRLSAALIEFWHLHVHHNEAQRWLEEALTKEDAPPSVRVKALERAGFLAWEQGDYERAVALSEEALGLARRLGDEASAAAALFNLGSVAMSRMEVEQASTLLEEAVALWRASGNDWGLAHAIYVLGLVAVVQRDHDRAMARHQESLALARKAGNEVGILQALGLGALTALLRGDHGQADALNKATMEMSRRLGIRHYVAGCLASLSASAGLQGHLVRATRLRGVADSLFEAMGLSRMPAEVSFYEPYFDAVRAQLSEAEWERAWTEGRAMGMEEAIEYVRSDEKDAPSTPSEPSQRVGEESALTHREEEIARLVARGLTNRQIASELSISEHTVATHVAKILKKLGFGSRSQVTAWVVEQRTLPSTEPQQ